ncbi:LysR family transcriptional regulator [Mycobacteroides chelonae]|uniref:LysR family transcriptional regulator n=1 Tax=Mycobacteroides chelonae TaxID=1774 RepID=UPI0008A9605C|nr:LysR family transcriptional regulator [Mycobacteroides chelonae]OHU64966.1 hypothetical protein BKG85_05015 [Mycobacteroides chelonae]
MWNDLPPMNSLVPFEAMMRHGTLARAAAELHVTHGAVSRQLRILERSVGVKLFLSEGRTLTPTAAAIELNEQVIESLSLLSAAVRQVRPSPQRPLVLSCEPTLMMRWLLPRMGSLLRADPTLELHLSAAGGPIDLRSSAADAAIRRNDFDVNPSLTVRPLFPEWIGPVCTPEIASAIRSAADLPRFPQLTSQTRQQAWTKWAALANIEIPQTVNRTFEHFYLSLEAASAGLGVAIGPYPLVAADLEAGRLIAPLGFVEDGTQYVLLSQGRVNSARIDSLYRWLCDQAATSVPPPTARVTTSTSG